MSREIPSPEWMKHLTPDELAQPFYEEHLRAIFDGDGFPRPVGRIEMLPITPHELDERFLYWASFGLRMAPRHLFHFTPIRRATQIIEQRKLLATSLHDLEDKREMWAGLKIGQREIDRMLKGANSPLHSGIRNVFNDCVRRDFASLSLTDDPNSERMWREYGRSKGVRFCFDTSRLAACLPDRDWGMRQCVYAPSVHRRQITQAIWCFASKADRPASIVSQKDFEGLITLHHIHLGIADALHIICSFMKPPEFRWEREWRLLSFSEDQSSWQGIISLRRGGSGRARAIAVPVEAFRDVVAEVAYDPNCEEERVRKLRDALGEIGCADRLSRRSTR